MKRMIWPGQRQQHIGIQQKHFHSSSQARRMALSEIIGAPGCTSKVGKRFPPLRVEPWGIWTARRIKSEMTWPNRLPEVLASVTTVSYASSSRVTVVLMVDTVMHRCQFDGYRSIAPRLISPQTRSRRPRSQNGRPTANPSARFLALLRRIERPRRSVAPASRCEQTLRPEENGNPVTQAQVRRARQWFA